MKNAFLNGDLEEEVYMKPPSGFTDQFESKMCWLRKTLYGLKQSPRTWFERFTKLVKSQGYSQGQSNHTLFTKKSSTDRISVLIGYVDDIILAEDDVEKMRSLRKTLAKKFEIKNLGHLKYFLGMGIARSKKEIVVSQCKYVLDLLKETGTSGCKPSYTSIEANGNLREITDDTPVNKKRYQRLVGRLIYLSYTQRVSKVSQFMHSPCEKHLEVVYRILRYLKRTPLKRVKR